MLKSDAILLFTYGKYKHEPVAEVVKRDPGYVIWAYEKNTYETNGGVPHSLYLKAKAALAKARRPPGGPRIEYRRHGRPVVHDEDYPRVTRYADGSSEHDFGGPCGPLYLDRDGNS